MFWDIWRRNGGLGSWGSFEKKESSKAAKNTYGKLVSTSESVPKKSISQPVNLSQYSTTNYDNGATHTYSDSPEKSQTQTEMKTTGVDGKKVKRSFSSFFPFSSCSSSAASSVSLKSLSSDSYSKTNPSQNLDEVNSPIPDTNRNITCQESNSLSNHYTNDGNWDSDSIEFPTCEVCAREFPSIRQLAAHQRKKRHYGCIECDSIFPSRKILEYHREQMCHYEFATDMYDLREEDLNDEDFYDSDEEVKVPGLDEHSQEDWDEEMRRLI